MQVEIGPGQFESVFEAVPEKLLRRQGLEVSREQPVEILGLDNGTRAELVIENELPTLALDVEGRLAT
jgi:hypothetical protein